MKSWDRLLLLLLLSESKSPAEFTLVKNGAAGGWFDPTGGNDCSLRRCFATRA